jgi:hypothetical protein
MVQEDQCVDHFFRDINGFGRGVVNVLEGCLDGATNKLSQVADEMFGGRRMELFQQASDASNQRKAIQRIFFFGSKKCSKVRIVFQLRGRVREGRGRESPPSECKSTRIEITTVASLPMGQRSHRSSATDHQVHKLQEERWFQTIKDSQWQGPGKAFQDCGNGS